MWHFIQIASITYTSTNLIKWTNRILPESCKSWCAFVKALGCLAATLFSQLKCVGISRIEGSASRRQGGGSNNKFDVMLMVPRGTNLEQTTKIVNIRSTLIRLSKKNQLQ